MQIFFSRLILKDCLSSALKENLVKIIKAKDEPLTLEERYFILETLPRAQWPEGFELLLEHEPCLSTKHKFLWAYALELEERPIPEASLNTSKAIALYEECAQAGLPQAHFLLGYLFHNSDPLKSLNHYLKAVEQGLIIPLLNLYVIYQSGLGPILPNPALAFDYLQKATNLDLARAQKILGLKYTSGISDLNIPADFEKALDLLQKVALQNDPEAPYLLDHLLKKAFKSAKQAAQAGHKEAQHKLRSFYRHKYSPLSVSLKALSLLLQLEERPPSSSLKERLSLLTELNRVINYSSSFQEETSIALYSLGEALNLPSPEMTQLRIDACLEILYSLLMPQGFSFSNSTLRGKKEALKTLERKIFA